jgi:uncharacterized protein
MRNRYLGIIFVLLLLPAPATQAAEVLPPAPRDHFNDYADVVAPQAAAEFDRTLTQFEKETSNQLVVVVYPRMQTDSSIEDYTVRLAQSWKVGQKEQKNGVVLFVFVQDHKMRIEVGYGLEGALPDAICKRIIDDEIAPQFKHGAYASGLRAGIDAICQATRGEYKPRPASPISSFPSSIGPCLGICFFAFFILSLLIAMFKAVRGIGYSGSGRYRSTWSSGWGGGWSSGGGGSWGGGGGGGSFSGGGGSFGGGGASGSW